MENKFLNILTTGFRAIREEQNRQQAQMERLTDMLMTESAERRQQGNDLWAQIGGQRPHTTPVHFNMAQHDAELQEVASSDDEEGGDGATPVEKTTRESGRRCSAQASKVSLHLEAGAPATPSSARGGGSGPQRAHQKSLAAQRSGRTKRGRSHGKP